MTDTTSSEDPSSESNEAAYGEAMGALFGLMDGFMRGHVLRTGLELGIFEALGSEPQAAAEIASGLGLEPEHTHRLLRALAPLGRYLEDNHPATIRALQ